MRAPSGIDKTTKSNRCGTIKLRSHKWSLTPTRNRAAGAPFCAASIAAQVSPRSDGLHADFLFASINAGMAFIASAPHVYSTKILWQNDHSPTSQKTMRTSITKEITKGVYHWRGKAFRHLVTLFAIAYGRSEIDAPDYPASANLDCVHRFWNFWAPST